MPRSRSASEDSIDPKDLDAAILVFANYIGIDLESPKQKHLIAIAEEAFRNIPEGWELGIGYYCIRLECHIMLLINAS